MRELVMPDLDLIKQAKQGGYRRSERPIPPLFGESTKQQPTRVFRC